MTHNEKRGRPEQEMTLALFTGSIYGATHTLTGHPLDTIKSKMQVQAGYTSISAWQVAALIWKNEGVRGFYRGCVPPLWGSMAYRGVMMSAYELAYTSCEQSSHAWLREELVVGIRPMVPLSSMFAATVRAVIESPIEYAKVMGQTNQQWKLAHIYRGFGAQVARTTTLLIPIFVMIDLARRKTQLMTTMLGNFAVTAAASGAAYVACWPLETLKNLAQSGTPHPGASVAQRVGFMGGPRGLMRGVGPGALAGAMRNGLGMVAMVEAHKWATRLGLRD
jgi:solute carrier family 25 carnitine/acylcarnitine transporter 20/29